MKKLLRPFARINKQTFSIMVSVQIIFVLILWHTFSDGLLPKPEKVAAALVHLSTTKALWDNILVSLLLTLRAMFYAILITLVIAYLSVLPFFKSIALFIVECRYLTLAGLI